MPPLGRPPPGCGGQGARGISEGWHAASQQRGVPRALEVALKLPRRCWPRYAGAHAPRRPPEPKMAADSFCTAAHPGCRPPACRLDPCPCDVVADNQPTVSGGSNLDSADMVELPAVAGPLCGSDSDAADQEAGTEEAAPAGLMAAAAADAAQSDNEDGADDVPAPKFRKLICSEPPPAVRVSLLLCGVERREGAEAKGR